MAGLIISDTTAPKDCQSSITGKMQCLMIPKLANKKPCNVLEFLHIDVCGPTTPLSKDGSYYFVAFIEKFSRWTVLNPVTANSEIVNRFREYH